MFKISVYIDRLLQNLANVSRVDFSQHYHLNFIFNFRRIIKSHFHSISFKLVAAPGESPMCYITDALLFLVRKK